MTPKDMMVIDANTEALGIPRASLMENAGHSLAEIISGISKPCKISIYAGNGGNGGDGFVAARYLLNKGFEVNVYLLAHPSQIKSTESRTNWEVLQKINLGLNDLKISVLKDSSDLHITDSDVIIDALLGTGIEGKLREPISSAIDVINNSPAIKVAVDVPSGLDPLTGKVFDKAVKADVTVTFHKIKIGLKDAKKEYVGNIHVCDIGIPNEAEIFTGPGDLLRFNNRKEWSHKGQNGKVLVIGGSKDYSGAPAIAALSSLKSGVDLAILSTPSNVSNIIRSYSPDLIVKNLSEDYIKLKDVDKILEFSKDIGSLVIGCGMGLEDDTGTALNQLLDKIQKPMVIDADALKLIDIDLIRKIRSEVVLTPHANEFKDLFGIMTSNKLEDKIQTVLKASKSCDATILMKGLVDIIASNDRFKLNFTGNPGMTVGGTGDCLAGLVGGLLAQGHEGYEAAFLGAYINGRAGDLAILKYGYNFTTSDLLKFIPDSYK
ncbi:MAG: NAD(P)H-hydrate dehydratase [Methanobacterium sp.]|jgi:NAD(P)H-hydrate epimerase